MNSRFTHSNAFCGYSGDATDKVVGERSQKDDDQVGDSAGMGGRRSIFKAVAKEKAHGIKRRFGDGWV